MKMITIIADHVSTIAINTSYWLDYEYDYHNS